MASGTKSKGTSGAKGKGAGAKGKGGRAPRASVVSSKPKPWGTIVAVIGVLALAAGVFTYAFVQINEKNKWVVSEDNKDPSEKIDGIFRQEYKGSQHMNANQRVAYDHYPPIGGPHDNVWADCTGVVYATAVRNENMVHSLEHGTVWIAYNPDQIKDAALDKLKSKVEGQPYLMLSPYPGLDRPISLQSWGHQLKLDSADDGRIDDFIKSLRANRFTTPEPGGRCDPADPAQFDASKPPPFVAEPPGPDAVKMDGTGATDAGQGDANGQVPPPTAPPSGEVPPASGAQPPPSQ
jgi:uncharacterized protein DUF3105